jgi:pSer/pThr/pTyr-binding forkhead associated (FHA) protein
MADRFCTQCGHRNPGNARFCASCGTQLDASAGAEEHTITLTPIDPDAPEEMDLGVEDIPDGAATLVVTRGPGAGSRFLLDAEVIQAGRHPDSDIFLDDVTVSRRHAEVARREGGWVVRDVGSLNGTYVNRQRIEDESVLTTGDEVQIGRFKLVFLTGAS